MIQTKIEKTTYAGWRDCYRVSNGLIQFTATALVGPRIISLSFEGQKNLFHVYPDTAGQCEGDGWKIYGGHRLWHSPEEKVRTYETDNRSIEVEEIADGLFLRQPVEPRSGIQKMIEITMPPSRAQVHVVHRLKDHGVWPIEMAGWALSVMEQGGFAVVPLPTRYHPDYLLPNRSLTLWPYTDLRDERLLLGKDFVLMRQLEGRNPCKLGILSDEEWAAYYLKPCLFVKRFSFAVERRYPDFDSSVEAYTNGDMLELETLSPLQVIPPGSELVHEERWELYDNVDLDFTEESVRAVVLPLVR
ncbi:MAG: hypothetical protein EHM61_02140 [Acidobacteria bacterium]|nr:MAG: hypothetical protein EHM61_02140 [Acidobacteriota bacterium]